MVLSERAAANAFLAAVACLYLPGTALAFGGAAGPPSALVDAAVAPLGSRSALSGRASSAPSSPPAPSREGPLTTVGSSSALFATWSNGQAIKEYQDFLATGQSDIEWADDGPSVVVAPACHVDGSKPSPVVDAIVALGEGDDVVLQPGDPLPAEMGGRESYPIYVALPPYELDAFLNYISHFGEGWSGRADDFVFLSGGERCGSVEHVLKPRGYCRDTMTQVLLGGMTLPDNPYKPQDISVNLGLDAQGEAKWAGECSACGKWGGAFARRLGRGSVRCRVGFYREWRRWMWERAMYDAVFNLVGAVREEKTSLSDVALYYEEEVSDMMWQISMQLRGMLAVTVTYGFEERLFGIAEMRGTETQCTLDPTMYPYIFPKTIAETKDVSQYLNYAQSLGKLEGVALPRAGSAEKPSAMRKGNLRADGVL